MGPICPQVYVYGKDDHKLTNMMLVMMSVSYQEWSQLLAFEWVWHAFAFIYMCRYSWYMITRSYHAYFITMRSDVGHVGYQSFNFKWNIFYLFYCNYILFYFPPSIVVHIYLYWSSIAWGHYIRPTSSDCKRVFFQLRISKLNSSWSY